MTSAALQKALHQRPFNPFVLHVSETTAYEVPSPDFIAHKPGSRLCVILNLNDSGFAWVDLAQVTKMTFAAPPLPAELTG